MVLPSYKRPILRTLVSRLEEPRRFIQVVAGPRQVGKTTLARQALADLDAASHYASADDPALRDRAWIAAQWELGRLRVRENEGAILALDEIQKIPGWSDTVKELWDGDTASGIDLRVMLLGSSPLLIQQGLQETLAGRFELVRVTHWSHPEMQAAFGWSVDQFVYFGGYPGAAPLINEEDRWSAYVRDSLVETTVSRDILLLERVNKPALLRQLFRLGCDYSAQILSYNKMLGQLHDAGNTTTLAHYLTLLSGAGMLAGLQAYSGSAVRRRGSSPKLLALDTGLINAESWTGGFDARRADAEAWGRLVESAVGAHLVNSGTGTVDVLYWRERQREVDYVLRRGSALVAVEVKSGRAKTSRPGLAAFLKRFGNVKALLVGGDGIPLAEFLSRPAGDWFL